MPGDNRLITSKQVKYYVILDTNVLQYLNAPDIASGILNYIQEIIKSGYTLSISDFSIFELLSGAPRKNEAQLSALLDSLPRFAVDWQNCLTAAQISTVYRIEKSEFSSIEAGDKIIAATAILSNSIVLTANSNDFPRPFFKEFHKKFIYYKKKNKDQMISLYLLQPDLEQISFRFNNRN